MSKPELIITRDVFFGFFRVEMKEVPSDPKPGQFSINLRGDLIFNKKDFNRKLHCETVLHRNSSVAVIPVTRLVSHERHHTSK